MTLFSTIDLLALLFSAVVEEDKPHCTDKG